MWIEKLFSLKYVALLIASLLMITGLTGICLGVLSGFHAFMVLIGGLEGRVGLYLIESIDQLLFSLVVMILAAGIYKLFVGNEDTFSNSLVLKNIGNFKELKILLWETMLLTMTIWAALGFFMDDEVTYEQLILPASILLLALSLYIVRGKEREKR